ncbi:MAG TPA: hypothetical protein VIY48_19935 [Candidatus Paceibacterota bacterium]
MLSGLCAGGTPNGTITNLTIGPTATWIGSASSRTNATTFDWGNFVFGSDGLAIVLGFGRTTNNVTQSTLTIGGNAATKYYGEIDGDVNTSVAVWVLAITAGTLDITTTYSGATGATNYSCVGVWLLTNYLNAAPIDGKYHDNGGASTSNPISLSSPRKSITTYFNYHSNANGTSWDTATEQADILATDRTLSYADYTNNTGVDDVSFTQTPSWTTNASGLGFAAVWM